MPKFLILFTFLLCLSVNTAFSEGKYGTCIHDPNAGALQLKWKHYFEVKKKRAKINISVMAKKMRMDAETMRLLQAISEVEKLMVILDDLEAQFLKKAFIDKRFNDMISNPDFIEKLLKKQIDVEIKASALPFKDNPKFYELLDQVRAEVARPEISDALALFRTYDLGVLDEKYRKSAKAALALIRNKGATLAAVRAWINDPPYLKNLPLPSEKLGPFVVKYRMLLTKSITSFVEDRAVELAEAKKIFPKIKQNEIDEMNTIVPPTESNSFDDHIFGISDAETTAIDGVARTLWGEASSCEALGLPQFSAIGRIIADRSIAVCRARQEQDELVVKNTEVREKNWSTFLSNWAGIKKPAPGMQNKAVSKLKGLSDFGRKEKKDIPCAAQVISKKNQFSVWNSYTINKFKTGKVHKSIPNSPYEIQGPQSPGDDKALIRILCPEFQTEEQIQLWRDAVAIAEDIVKRPETVQAKFSWPQNVKGDILFYTHDASLYFAKEVKVKDILINGKPVPLRGKGRNPCHKFRLFVPKGNNQY